MSSGYYHQSYDHQGPPPLPLHLCFFFMTLLLFISLSWYLSYESAFESMMDNIKLFLILSPLFLLLALHWLSGGDGQGRGFVSFIPLPDERDSLHRAGGSPWGVALVLVLLLFMISYRSSFQERWFPLLAR